ncbi:protein rogdi isoform X1 [Anopheles maculipalpis]|uniref:protein rogdi isoform X1 n=1 Tax=Anopheles maculipalpis TaxID=1496333 RepID=UPI0021590666|nr:protein rogdi isoform X1 [Anopheles maculipalpis]
MGSKCCNIFPLCTRSNEERDVEWCSGSNWFTKPHSRRKSGKKVKVTFSDQLDTASSGSGSSVPTTPSPSVSAQHRWRYLEQIFVPASSNTATGNRSATSEFDRGSSFRQSNTSYGSVGSGPYNRRAPPQRKVGQKMADCEKEEALNLQVEFEWVLHEEVHSVLKQLHVILVECAHRFPVPLYGNEGKKQDKFVLTAAPEQLKCIVTLTGDSITHADINFKVQRQQQQIQRTSITQDYPWKIQQVQDAANHLQQAINHIDNVDSAYHFKTSDEVLHILGNILGALQRGRTSLVVPRKKPIDELMKSRNMKALSPNLPEDLAISFYIQSHKLIFVAYQLTNFQGTMKFDSCQAECSVPWLNEVLVLFTVALQLCQQLKDKISVFSQYKDFTVGSRSPSALSY